MKKVTIYTIPKSNHTKSVKKYFEKKKIPFTEIDIEKNPDKAKRLIEKTGYSVVPQIQIDDKFIIGFDRNKLNEILTKIRY